MHPERDGIQYIKEYQQGGNGQSNTNVLELKAVKLALLPFNKQKSLKAVHFQIDNTTALLNLMKMGREWGMAGGQGTKCF